MQPLAGSQRVECECMGNDAVGGPIHGNRMNIAESIWKLWRVVIICMLPIQGLRRTSVTCPWQSDLKKCCLLVTSERASQRDKLRAHLSLHFPLAPLPPHLRLPPLTCPSISKEYIMHSSEMQIKRSENIPLAFLRRSFPNPPSPTNLLNPRILLFIP